MKNVCLVNTGLGFEGDADLDVTVAYQTEWPVLRYNFTIYDIRHAVVRMSFLKGPHLEMHLERICYSFFAESNTVLVASSSKPSLVLGDRRVNREPPFPPLRVLSELGLLGSHRICPARPVSIRI